MVTVNVSDNEQLVREPEQGYTFSVKIVKGLRSLNTQYMIGMKEK